MIIPNPEPNGDELKQSPPVSGHLFYVDLSKGSYKDRISNTSPTFTGTLPMKRTKKGFIAYNENLTTSSPGTGYVEYDISAGSMSVGSFYCTFKSKGTASLNPMMGFTDNAGLRYEVYHANGNILRIFVNGIAMGWSTTDYNDDNEHHLLVTWTDKTDYATYKVWLDNVDQTANFAYLTTVAAVTADKLRLCGHLYNTTNRLNGSLLGQVGVLNKVVSETERNTIYNTYLNSQFVAKPRNGFKTVKPNVIKPIVDERDTGKQITVLREGDYAYIRTIYDDTRDMVQKIAVFDGDSIIDDNKPMNFYFVFLIPNTNLNTNSTTMLDSSVIIHSCSDDSAPMNYSGSYMGANHGLSIFSVANVASHDKTNVDIGSRWTDGAAKTWYLIRIESATKLWFLSANTGSAEDWVFTQTISGNLTHASGATHTTGVTVSSVTSDQIEPALKNQIKKLYLDNNVEVYKDGLYYSKNVWILNKYEIVNPASMLDNLIARVGTDLEPDFRNGDTQVTVYLTHKFDRFGGCLIDVEHVYNQLVDIGIDPMGLQAGQINKGSYSNQYIYCPNTLPINDSALTEWDFRTIRNFNSAPSSTLLLTDTYWADANIVPYRFLQFLGTDTSTLDVAFQMMYAPDQGVAKHSVRKSLSAYGFQLATTKKWYPYVLSSTAGDVPAGTIYNSKSYRGYFKPYKYSTNADSVFFFEDENSVYVTVDYHKVCNDTVTLPNEFNNLNITSLDVHSDVTVNSSSVSNNTISIDCAGTYGYAVLKLTKDDTLQSWYDMKLENETLTNRTRIKDKSGKGNHLTTIVKSQPEKDGITCDSGYVKGTNNNISAYPYTTNATFAGRLRIDEISGSIKTIYGKDDITLNNTYDLGVLFTSSGLSFQGLQITTTPEAIPLGKEIDYEIIISNSNIKVYIDGINVYDETVLRAINSTGSFNTSIMKPVDVIGKNMFDLNTMIIPGYYLSNTTGAIAPNATSAITTLIPCLPNTTYVHSGDLNNMSNITKRYYDANGNYLSFHNSGTGTRYWTTPADCFYMQMTIAIVDASPVYTDVQIEQAQTATSYAAYSKTSGTWKGKVLQAVSFNEAKSEQWVKDYHNSWIKPILIENFEGNASDNTVAFPNGWTDYFGYADQPNHKIVDCVENNGGKRIEVTGTNAAIAKPSNQVYGEWRLKFSKGSSGNLYYDFIEETTAFTNYMYFGVYGPNRYIYLSNYSGPLFQSANDYIENDTVYEVSIIRTFQNNWYVYIKCGNYTTWTLVTASSGSNPTNDNTNTSSQLVDIYGSSGDYIDCIKFYSDARVE